MATTPRIAVIVAIVAEEKEAFIRSSLGSRANIKGSMNAAEANRRPFRAVFTASPSLSLQLDRS